MPKHIDKDMVRALFNYNPETGELTEKFNRSSKAIKGELVGYKHRKDYGKFGIKYYFKVYIFGDCFFVHRAIWVLMTGEQPKEIDHIDGDSLNNKWSNLRSVNHVTNGRNQKMHSTNTSGTGGVTYRKDSDSWRARITVDDKSISLGTYNDKQDAIQARKEAEIKYWGVG